VDEKELAICRKYLRLKFAAVKANRRAARNAKKG
jgi:hypothetical protein